MKIYRKLALTTRAWLHDTKNKEKHRETIEKLVSKYLPNGSGINNGVTFNFEESSVNWLVFNSSYHLNFDGSYGDWIDFTVAVYPSLIMEEIGIIINGKTTGENYDIHDYLYEVFYDSLIQEI
jgi:hypothetical protein